MTFLLTLTEFEDADTAEITPRVSAGQGKKIRIKPTAWNKPIEQIKKLLPQYTIARKLGALTGENKEMFDNCKKALRNCNFNDINKQIISDIENLL